MLPLVAPPVRRALIAIALDGLPAASPEGLVYGAFGGTDLARAADALYFGTLVVMGDEAGAVGVLDVGEVFMAADAMAHGRRG